MYKRDEKEIEERLKSDYDYLTSLGYEVMAVVLQGPQNYDLDYYDSDTDTKAIVLPKFKDLMMGKKPTSTTLKIEGGEQIDVKDIREMFKNFLKQNVNFLEILFSDYYYANPDYAYEFKTLRGYRENIARYDNYRAVNCMMGMMYQKHKAMEHPYPSLKDKIDEFGYDGKQLHHILRNYQFMQKYMNGDSFQSCLKTEGAEQMIRIKANEEYSLEEAREIAEVTMQKAALLKEGYSKNTKHEVNKRVKDLLDNLAFEILSERCIRELEGLDV